MQQYSKNESSKRQLRRESMFAQSKNIERRLSVERGGDRVRTKIVILIGNGRYGFSSGNSLRLFRARNLYRSFGAPSDRFDHLCAVLFYQLSRCYLHLSLSLSVFLSALRENAYLSRTQSASRISGSNTLPSAAATRIARLNVRTYRPLLFPAKGYLPTR